MRLAAPEKFIFSAPERRILACPALPDALSGRIHDDGKPKVLNNIVFSPRPSRDTLSLSKGFAVK